MTVPLLVMFPSALRAKPFGTVSSSPELLKARVPKTPPLTFMFTSTEAAPMVTASAPVGTPPVQFPAVPQLLSPESPVHESAVRGGGALGFVFCADAPLTSGRWLSSACCESLRFDSAAVCAETKPSRLKRTARRHRAAIHRMTTREDDGRMGRSERKILRARRTGSWHNVHGQKASQWPPDEEPIPSPL